MFAINKDTILAGAVEAAKNDKGKTMHVSIEMFDGKSYGYIHKTGCRDLRDPERLGDVSTKAEAEALAEDLTGWGYDDGEYRFAPCVKLNA